MERKIKNKCSHFHRIKIIITIFRIRKTTAANKTMAQGLRNGIIFNYRKFNLDSL